MLTLEQKIKQHTMNGKIDAEMALNIAKTAITYQKDNCRNYAIGFIQRHRERFVDALLKPDWEWLNTDVGGQLQGAITEANPPLFLEGDMWTDNEFKYLTEEVYQKVDIMKNRITDLHDDSLQAKEKLQNILDAIIWIEGEYCGGG